MSFCFWIVASRLKLGNWHSIRHDVCSVDVKPEKLTLHDKVPPTQWSPLLAVPRMLFVSSLLLVLPFSQPPILCSLCVPLLAPAEPMILATLRFRDALSPRQNQTTLDLLQARSNCNARQSNTVSAATFFRWVADHSSERLAACKSCQPLAMLWSDARSRVLSLLPHHQCSCQRSATHEFGFVEKGMFVRCSWSYSNTESSVFKHCVVMTLCGHDAVSWHAQAWKQGGIREQRIAVFMKTSCWN